MKDRAASKGLGLLSTCNDYIRVHFFPLNIFLSFLPRNAVLVTLQLVVKALVIHILGRSAV